MTALTGLQRHANLGANIAAAVGDDTELRLERGAAANRRIECRRLEHAVVTEQPCHASAIAGGEGVAIGLERVARRHRIASSDQGRMLRASQ